MGARPVASACHKKRLRIAGCSHRGKPILRWTRPFSSIVRELTKRVECGSLGILPGRCPEAVGHTGLVQKKLLGGLSGLEIRVFEARGKSRSVGCSSLDVEERGKGKEFGRPVCMPVVPRRPPRAEKGWFCLLVKVELVFQEHVGVHRQAAASTEQVHD